MPSAGWTITLVIRDPQRDGCELNRKQSDSFGCVRGVYQLLLVFETEILARVANYEEKVLTFDDRVSDALRFDCAAKRCFFAKIICGCGARITATPLPELERDLLTMLEELLK